MLDWDRLKNIKKSIKLLDALNELNFLFIEEPFKRKFQIMLILINNTKLILLLEEKVLMIIKFFRFF